jgi:hypothetical protein
MTKFLNDVQGMFAKHGWPYVLPKVSRFNDEDGEPGDRMIDAHWKEKEFELLLSVDDGGFAFYGDNYGKGKTVRHGDASPQDLAEGLHLLIGG